MEHVRAVRQYRSLACRIDVVSREEGNTTERITKRNGEEFPTIYHNALSEKYLPSPYLTKHSEGHGTYSWCLAGEAVMVGNEDMRLYT